MANIYKLDNNWVSSALIPLETIFSNANIKCSSSAVNIFTAKNIALGLNVGSRRIAYKHNDILFKVKAITNGTNKMTYVTRPSIERGFVQWNGDFNWFNVISDLLAITIDESADDVPENLEFTIDSSAKTLVSGGDAPFTISWSSSELTYEDGTISGAVSLSAGKAQFTLDADKLLARLNGDFSTITTVDYTTPETPYDLSYSLVDGESGLFEEREITLDYSSLIFDDFGHQYYSVPDYDFGVSQDAVWLPNEDHEYLPADQFAFVLDANGVENAFATFNKDRLRSAVNTDTLYIEGLIQSSVKTYIGYAKVYSSHIYVDYYYIKPSEAEGECAKLEDSVSHGRACRLKITSSKITIKNIDSNIDHISLIDDAQSLAHDAYSKLRFGVGCFKSNYKLYSYRDKRDSIEVIFNRESSSKYTKVTIEDQPTRYSATIAVKSGTNVNTTTKHFARHSSHPLWSLRNTAYINTIIKKAFDNVSDTTETLFTNGSIVLDQESIKILTRTLYVNILQQAVSFPQLDLTYDTLSVVACPDADGNVQNLQINFQPATGAIYGRIMQGSSYDYYDKDDLLSMLNAINASYEFSMTCNISSLTYTDTDGNDHVYQFTNSTMIIAEIVNGANGQFYRVYYKNADSYGFVNANSYKIQE